MLLLVGLLTAALVASLVIVGALVLRDDGPDGLNGGLWSRRSRSTPPGTRRPSPASRSRLASTSDPMATCTSSSAGSHEIIVVDPAGTVVRRWGEEGSGEGQFLFHRNPADPFDAIGSVAVGPDGSVYVADMVNDRVQQFTPERDVRPQLGGPRPR